MSILSVEHLQKADELGLTLNTVMTFQLYYRATRCQRGVCHSRVSVCHMSVFH